MYIYDKIYKRRVGRADGLNITHMTLFIEWKPEKQTGFFERLLTFAQAKGMPFSTAVNNLSKRLEV